MSNTRYTVKVVGNEYQKLIELDVDNSYDESGVDQIIYERVKSEILKSDKVLGMCVYAVNCDDEMLGINYVCHFGKNCVKRISEQETKIYKILLNKNLLGSAEDIDFQKPRKDVSDCISLQEVENYLNSGYQIYSSGYLVEKLYAMGG